VRLDKAGHLVSIWAHFNLSYRIVSCDHNCTTTSQWQHWPETTW